MFATKLRSSVSRRVIVVMGVVAVVVVGLAVPAGASSVSPSKWAPKFCNALVKWQSTLKTEGEAASSSISSHSTDLAAARDDLVSYLGKSVAATKTAITTIKAAGTPSSANGAKIASKLVGGFQAAATVFAKAKADAAKLSTTDASAFADAGSQIQTNLSTASDKVTSGFTGIAKLDAKNELNRALAKASACKAVSG
jgi:hypothetical protein